ncbi:MAG: hypothetical protein K6G23_07310, partial [Lachnospiraceae bacterium]|nr:hypothetical protein [Lachnospiraceae bacterium]
MKTVLDNIDVICYYARDGSIRPLRIRITGDDGTYRVYRIESYHEVEGQGARTMPDGVYVSNMTRI